LNPESGQDRVNWCQSAF